MSSHQTTTTTTTNVTPLIWFDKSYVQSNAGLIKIVLIIVNLAAFIVNQFGNSYGGTRGFFSFATMSGFWLTLALFLFYAFHVIERFYYIQWLLAEFLYFLLWCLFLAVSSLLLVIYGKILIVAGILGFISTVLYGYEAKTAYTRYSNGEIAQGERTMA